MKYKVYLNKNDYFNDENNIETKYSSPIIRWKELIGPKNSLDDKNKSTLRGEYGVSLIENSLYGSDTSSDAYKEISCKQG